MTSREKPLTLLRRFARNLGWSPLRQYSHLAKDDPAAKKPYLITWYKSGQAIGSRSDFFLQINEFPIGQTKIYQAAVYAIRYRICTLRWRFRLHLDERRQESELKRLRPWLDRAHFDSLTARNEFRLLHKECTAYSWRKIRQHGLPNANER